MSPADRTADPAPAPPDAPVDTSTGAFALRGDLLDLVADPGFGTPQGALQSVRFRPDHWLLVDADGRIAGAQPADRPPPQPYAPIDHRGHLVLPGFIDTHVHAPQLDVIASYGGALLDWLSTYTYPAERAYADPLVAHAGANRFLDALLSHGTTAAVVFPTVHATSVDALCEGALARGMRLVTGKVLMDRHAPDGLRDDVDGAERDCTDLIDRWHGRGRLAYAVTPRFAASSTPEQLAMAGRLCAQHRGVYMQTHVAENRDEVRWIGELYPTARSYLDVYDRHGLLGPRSVLAHGIWLDDADRARLRECGAQIAHSPSSNLFLGSGLFDWPQAEAAGVRVSVASDVGGGTGLSAQHTLLDAYKVQALRGTRLTAWKALHAVTRAPAEALGLGREIGTLEVGAVADLTVWRWAEGAVARHRDAIARDLHERVFAWLALSDDRNLVETRIAGVPRFRRAASADASG
jgi:guanine deaminase